ncbi:MAG: glycosyltransferase [Gammaproteobacteria bacterium]|nr:glycosyltransferase [Gammaproteobacteria bacterium]
MIAHDNGRGLSRNIELLRRVLESANWEVTVTGERPLSLVRRAGRLALSALPRPHYDVNLFLERIVPAWLRHARKNALIPNQEWFREKGLKYLGRLDLVLCQTRHAETVFRDLGCRTAFSSFTSLDRWLPGIAGDPRRFLHLSGAVQRGTQALLSVWTTHPEWPALDIVQRDAFEGTLPCNVRAHVGLSDSAVRELQNVCGVHVQPSRAEGFGHSIVEGLSCAAVVVTTDGAPMNEVVTAERGMLAGWRSSETMRLGTAYDVDPVALAACVERALALDPAERARLRAAARTWFEENDRYFRERLIELLDGL